MQKLLSGGDDVQQLIHGERGGGIGSCHQANLAVGATTFQLTCLLFKSSLQSAGMGESQFEELQYSVLLIL